MDAEEQQRSRSIVRLDCQRVQLKDASAPMRWILRSTPRWCDGMVFSRTRMGPESRATRSAVGARGQKGISGTRTGNLFVDLAEGDRTNARSRRLTAARVANRHRCSQSQAAARGAGVLWCFDRNPELAARLQNSRSGSASIFLHRLFRANLLSLAPQPRSQPQPPK